MHMLSERRQKQLYLFLILLSIPASFKMIFFAVGLDEEYQLVMAYRNVRGDRLFLDMWEPHQSSAFLCALLMKPWLALFGTTGVVLYLRICGTLLHLGISLYLYKVLKDSMDTAYARLLALTYYNTIPKQIILPEFGIMQVWCYTLLALFLARYYFAGRHPGYLVLAAFSLVLNVLSYPSCLILFPFLLIFLTRFSGSSRWRDMGIVTSVCILCGLGYLGILFTETTPKELPETISHILAGDVTHSLSFGKKLLSFLTNALFMAALWAVCLVSSLAVARRKKLNRKQTCCLTAIFACIVELFYWVVLGKGFETMHIHLVAFTLAGLCACSRTIGSRPDSPAETFDPDAHNKPNDPCSVNSPVETSAPDSRGEFSSADSHDADSPVRAAAPLSGNENPMGQSLQKHFLYCIMAGALLSLLAVTYLTDLSFAESVPHALPAAFCGAILLLPQRKKEDNAADNRWIYAALTVWCLTAVFGKGYTLRSGTEYNNVLLSGGIMRKGPAAGMISNYIGAHIYNCDYEDWQSYVQDGDRVLIMVDQVMNLGTIQYLFKDVEISHFSIVNPTAYDERLLEYWDLYPEKYPNVIIVDCWYGQLMTDPEGWLMQYIENEFGYTQVNDGQYIRIYRK